MARIFPDDFHSAEGINRFSSEITTLMLLKDGLSDQYCIYHGAHWTRLEGDAAIYGEIDFLIVNPYGKILAIEQKETAIEKGKDGDLNAIYYDSNRHKSEKSIRTQVTRNIQSLRQEFSRRYPDQNLEIDHLLYLPTANLEGVSPVNIALGRIVDLSESSRLVEIIGEMFDKGQMQSGKHPADPIAIQDFLSEKAEISPQVGLIGKSAKVMTTRLSEGLAKWAERLEFSPYRLWVQGTAGSGKTQLALKELRRAKSNQQTAMYLCFNRPLADAMKLIAPIPSACMTFHELAELIAKQKGQFIDFKEEGIFSKLAELLISSIGELKGHLDVLIVDEGQDFEREWGEALVTLVKEGGRIIWLEDPSQDLYHRWNTDWPEWVKITSPVNYRSPQRLVGLMNALELTADPMESGNGYAGMVPDICPYQKGMEIEATEAAVKDLMELGYLPESIVVLSFRGASNSRLLADGVDKLNGLQVKKFIGYGENGKTLWSQGSLHVDTLFRFKGQCADAVVLTEIDFNQWSDNVKKRLFVGISRARLMVSLVVAEETSELLYEML
jgi:hypothetical protein